MTKILRPSYKQGKYQGLLRILKQKYMLVFGIAFLSFLSTALILQNIKPIYTAKAQLIFENLEPDFIKTQKSLLESNNTANAVINRLKLFDDSAFNTKASTHNISKKPKFKTINFHNTRLLSVSAQIIAQDIEPIIARFNNNFITIINSNVIDLEYNSHKPQKAAIILNEIIKIYLENITPDVKPKPKPSLIKNNKIVKNLTSPAMQRLKLQYIALKKELASISIGDNSNHLEIISLKSQLINVGKQILGERYSIILRLEKKEKKKGEKVLSQPKSLTLPENSDKQEVKLPVQILSQVSVSHIPTFPNKLKILSLGAIISLLIGILMALFSEKIRNNFLSAGQLEEYLNLPCYALIPNAKKDKDKPLSNYVMDYPSSDTAEAVRALNLVIKLCADDEDRKSKVVAITSSLPDEGKTTLSAWLAQLAAKSGKKAILIDADLRRPTIHKVFESKNTLSLVEYLSGNNKLEEVIDTKSPSGLHIIYGRSVPNSALDLLSSDKMEQLVKSLRKAYDLVIIDTPASMAVSDARAIATISDQLLYAVLWNKTSREIVHKGITQFTKFKKAQVATVLTNIDLKKHVKMGYGEAVNYYGSYK